MPDDSTQPDDLLSGIYQTDIKPTLADRHARAFFAWHKPRKHYLRVHQWCAELEALLTRNGYQSGDVIRYLGFPGEDFLDVRALQQICSKAKVSIHYLGFDCTASYIGRDLQFNLSQHEVFQLGYINQHSWIFKARVEQLADTDSVAYKRATAFRDFDVINLDLCDSLASEEGAEHPGYFEAIKNLCDLQIAGRVRPWLLFLTTRTNRELLKDDTKFKLFNCVLQNVTSHKEFAEQLNSVLSLDAAQIRKELSNAAPLDHSTLCSLFGLSVGKWLLHILSKAVPKLRVRMLPSYSYRVHHSEPDMLSLAFAFEPLTSPTQDGTGLTKHKAKPAPQPTEESLAVDLLPVVNGIQDTDELLKANKSLHDDIVDQFGDLLASAHYDKEKYKTWVATEGWKKKKKPKPTGSA